MNTWNNLLEKKGMGTHENNFEKMKLELKENGEKLNRRENMISENRLEIRKLKLENKRLNEISLMKGEQLLKNVDKRKLETRRIQMLENQIKDMRINTKKIISAVDVLDTEKTDTIKILKRNLSNEKHKNEEYAVRLNISKLMSQSLEERLEKQNKELEIWKEIGIKQNWLFLKMKEIGLQQSEDIFECFEDIKIPNTSTYTRELYIPTNETSAIDIVLSDEDEEYYHRDSEIERIFLEYHAIQIQKIFRGYLIRKKYPFSLDSF